MAFRTSAWGMPPGLTAASETYEAAFRWGQDAAGIITGGLINAATIDSGNTPTYEIRPGLLLAQLTADGTWVNYSPTGTGGAEIAAGVNLTSLRMQDILTGSNTQRFYGILVGGPIQAAKIINLDLMARQQMDKFIFDDVPGGYVGNHWYPFKRFQTKTANYTVLASDNFTLFDTTGAGGEVDFTLPAIANGYFFGFHNSVAQTLKVISAEGTNLVALNNASATSVAYSTGGQQIGAAFYVYSNPGATKWIVENSSAGTATVTVA